MAIEPNSPLTTRPANVPPTKPGAILGVLLVSVLLASAMGGLVVARMMQERRASSGPQIDVTRSDGGRTTDETGLPLFHSLPDFQLQDQSGHPLTKQSIAGKVVVANFIFTRCAMICPLLSRHMALLGKDTESIDPTQTKILRLSLSVDPEFDTPQILTAYAARQVQSKTPWLFATGKVDDVRTLIRDGFKLPLPAGAAESGGPLTHSESTVLIDGNGVVRGYYRIQEPLEKARLLQQIATLVAAGK